MFSRGTRSGWGSSIQLLVAIGILASGTYASIAAEMPTKAPVYAAPVIPPPYNWSGFYLGANFGAAWSNSLPTIAGVPWDPGSSRFIGGIEAGYNLQSGPFLIGIEGDFDGASFSRPTVPVATPPGLVLASANQQWISTLAARFGLVSDRWLIFGKVGGGWAHETAALNLPDGTSWNGSNTRGGALLGVGLEYGFKSHWTIKMEYDYLALQSWAAPTVPLASFGRDVQMVKLGINYKFESGLIDEAPSSGAKPKESSTGDIATKSQNPIADLVSVPFQNNTTFNNGPFGRAQNILNIEPVVPLYLNAEWNVVSRTIIPVTSQPNPFVDSSTNGIGDITQEFFLTPVHPGPLIWGVGPVITIPSASDIILGTGKVLAGPTVVVLVTPAHWVIGVLANNQWSVGGDPARQPVNFLTVQPFINYNMAGGWFLVSSPIITADWLAAPGQQWTVPLGGGVGRVFKIGDQHVSASLQGFYNAVRPNNTGAFTLRAYFSLLFPQ
jgi:opacity protein-like surface antigen